MIDSNPLAKLWRTLSLALCALLVAGTASAELTIRVTQGSDQPTVIAIAPFVARGVQVADDVAAIVEADLARSGLFRPVERANMLSMPASQDDVYYRDWRLLGADYLVIGEFNETATGKLQLTFGLFSVLGQRQMWSHEVTGSAAQLRDMAHLASDKIYQQITGLRGIFSTRVAYVNAYPERGAMLYRLLVSDIDGARERLLLESRQPIMSPAWSNDGKEIAYVSFETGRPAIFRQNLATASRRQLTDFEGLNSAPAWSPDGRSMALALSKDGNPELYLLDLASNQLTRLTRHFAIDTEPTWTPDGKQLLFTSDRGGTPQIYRLTLAGRKVERITWQGNYNARPSLAPDGRTLALIHRRERDYRIASLDLVTERIIELTDTALDESPTVAPNGAMLMYATKQGDNGVLAAVSLDAGVKYLLPARRGDVREPAWSPFVR